jgi:hypothetical protein
MRSDLVVVGRAAMLVLLSARAVLGFGEGDEDVQDEEDEQLPSEEEELLRLGEEAGPLTVGHSQARRSEDSLSRRTRFPLAQPRGRRMSALISKIKPSVMRISERVLKATLSL